jgi:uncharacterized protein (DUF433 family)
LLTVRRFIPSTVAGRRGLQTGLVKFADCAGNTAILKVDQADYEKNMSTVASALPFANAPYAAPLAADADGVIRVSGTRVALDSIIAAYLDGADAEDIAEQYPAVPLADVHLTLAAYLRYRSEIDAYLAERRAAAEGVRAENERRFDPTGVKARLLARQSASKP